MWQYCHDRDCTRRMLSLESFSWGRRRTIWSLSSSIPRNERDVVGPSSLSSAIGTWRWAKTSKSWRMSSLHWLDAG